LKAIVEVNRRLIAAVSELDEINAQKFDAAERLAAIQDNDPAARTRRQRLWARMETANASQKMLTFRCVKDMLMVFDRPI
jgi:hypothetical protein